MVRFFQQKGIAVVGIDSRVNAEFALEGVAQLKCDIRNVEEYRSALDGAEVLIHMASMHLQVGVSESTYWSVNVSSLPDLLKAAQEAGIRHFIHTSSVGVHGSLTQIPGDEESFICPENLYEKTKAAGEKEVQSFWQKSHPMGVTIVRPAWIYGIGDDRTERILRSVHRGVFVMFGNGRNHRHPIYITDYLEGIHQMMLQPQTFRRTYILAGPEFMVARKLLRTAENVTGGKIRLRVPMSVAYLASLLVEVALRPLGISPPVSRRTLAFFRNQNAFDTKRARIDFGFHPEVPIEEGFSKVWSGMCDEA